MGIGHGQVAAGRSHGPGWQGVVRAAANVAGLVRVVAHCKAVKGSLQEDCVVRPVHTVGEKAWAAQGPLAA